jgi:CheY-like chemotaxis protein/HD-like signal output (HDOD) protein
MIDILFVDDEDNVLRGLGRMLYAQRGAWRMRFATGAREALSLLEAAPADVVVSDMRMPDVDGASLLHIVRRRWPATVRIVLSGHAEESAMIRALGAAHRYLAKPCPKETLIAVIESAVDLRRKLPVDKEPLLLCSAGDLSSPGPVYAALLDVLAKPTLHQDALCDVVKRSDSLCAKLLHAANSGLVASRTPVATIDRAIDLLGVVALKAIAAEDAVETSLPTAMAARTGLAEEQAIAAEAQRLIGRWGVASGVSAQDRETAATVVVLSTVGYAAACAALKPAAVMEALARAADSGESRPQAVSDLLGAPVGGFGALLLALWGLPDGLVEGVLCAADPEASAAPDSPAVGLAHLALVAARRSARTDAAPGVADDDPLAVLGPELDRVYLERNGLETLARQAAIEAAGRDDKVVGR